MPPAAAPVDSAAPEHRHLGIALAVICTAQLMVVLDASIVNVALPSIQRALGFSQSGLEWVISGYTLAFGGLLLLGGRTGDLFGRRRMFMIGVSIFTVSSLLGGFATTSTWLVVCRVCQGVGGAIAAPTALSLVASTFAEGAARNRAMGVYAAMSGAGGAFGAVLGGLLTDSLGWRWVLFVNVPIGLTIVLLAPRVLGETGTRKGKLDLPGALSASIGMTLLVYGLINASTHPWSSVGTVVPLCLAAVLLVTFVAIESRSPHALMPLHLFKNRNRSAAYGIMLSIGTAIFSTFFFLTLFLQNVLGFSPLHAGLAFLPFAVTIMIVATIASKVVGRTGARTLIMIGTLLGSGGLLWFSRFTIHTTYLTGVLPPMLMIAGGMAMCFVPLTLTAVSGVRRDEAGIASALLNSGQQVGGSLGLAVLGTVAATVTRHHVANLVRSGAAGGAQVAHSALSGVTTGLTTAQHAALGASLTSGYTAAMRIAACIEIFAFLLAALVMKKVTLAQQQALAPAVEPAPA